MNSSRPDQMRREVSEMSGLYLLVVILVLAGAIFVHLAPRTDTPVRVELTVKEIGPH
mgnify:CR=1 FL=1